MKKILLISFCCLAFNMTSKAQQYSKGYLDSVKEFFNDWVQDKKPADIHFISEYTPGDSGSFNMNYEINSLMGTKDNYKTYSYKRVYKANGTYESVKNDSLSLSKKEKKMISEQLKKQAANQFNWDKTFFATSAFVKQKYMDSLFMHNHFKTIFTGGIWEFSLPVFLKNKPFCVLFHVYIPCSQGGEQAIELYKKEKGHWVKFGTVVSGDW